MNALVGVATNRTMSSREIAELTGKRHDNVMRTVRDLITAQVLTPQIEESNFEHQGNTYKQFLLNKRDSLIVVARLSPEFTAAVVDRWQELEATQQFHIPTNLSEALRLAADNIEARERAESQLAIAAPKADALDRIADSSGLFGVREAAKALKIKQNELVALLLARHWMFRDARNVLQGYADRIELGHVKHVVTGPIPDSVGQEHVYSHAKITSAGLALLGRILARKAAA